MARPSVHAAAVTCPHPDTFETFVREHFLRKHPKSEAAREIAALAKETSLSNAVALALESLPKRASAQLRKALDGYEWWCQTTLANLIFDNVRPFVRSFNGDELDIQHDYLGRVRAVINDADAKSVTVEPQHHHALGVTVAGDYIPPGSNPNLRASVMAHFSFFIYVRPNMHVELSEPKGLVPPDMYDDIKKALAR